jgi:hypothetical protein
VLLRATDRRAADLLVEFKLLMGSVAVVVDQSRSLSKRVGFSLNEITAPRAELRTECQRNTTLVWHLEGLLQENGSLLSSAFPRLCLSRACLGKLKVVGVLVYNSFSIKWRNEDVFRTCTADVIGRGIVIFTLLGSATPLPPDNARNFQRNDA